MSLAGQLLAGCHPCRSVGLAIPHTPVCQMDAWEADPYEKQQGRKYPAALPQKIFPLGSRQGSICFGAGWC